MNELVAVVKGQQIKDHKGQNRAGSDRRTSNGDKGGRNLRGPDPNASGPFRNGSLPIQCYNCWGWGHRASECPCHLNYEKGEGLKTGTNIPSPPLKPHVNRGQSSPNPETTPKQNQQ